MLSRNVGKSWRIVSSQRYIFGFSLLINGFVMLFIQSMKNSNIYRVSKKRHNFERLVTFVWLEVLISNFYTTQIQFFTHEYKISLNYEKMVGLWKWYLFWRILCALTTSMLYSLNYYLHTTSTLETYSFRVSISLKSELVSTIPQLTLLGKYHGHEWQRLMAYREFGDRKLYGWVSEIMLCTTV